MRKHSNRIIYILGSGRSGSTLLDLLLGSHENLFSLGEFDNLPAYINLDWECGCGSNISICEFWKDVTDRLDNSHLDHMKNHRTMTPHQKKIKRNYHLLFLNSTFKYDKLCIRLEKQIIEHIFNKTSCKWVVDSSKSPHRLLYLLKSGKFQLKVIYLVRDGRGYVSSKKKAPKLPTLYNKDNKGALVWKSSFNWLKTNLLCLNITKLLPKSDWLLLKYERLAQNSVGELKRMCNFIEAPFDRDMLNFSQRINHNIGGNRMRFNKVQKIKLDNSWKFNLTSKEKLIFNSIAGGLNAFFNNR